MYFVGIMSKFNIEVVCFILLFRQLVTSFNEEHQGLLGLIRLQLILLHEFFIRNNWINSRRVNNDLNIFLIVHEVIFIQAFGTSRVLDQIINIVLQEAFCNFHLDEQNKKGGYKCIAYQEDIEIEDDVEHICKVAVVLYLSEDFVAAHLEHLVEVTEKSQDVVVEILARIEQHRVEDEPVQENADLKENGSHQDEGVTNIGVKAVYFVLFFLFTQRFEDGDDLHKGTDRCIFLAEDNDDAHELEEEVPVSKFNDHIQTVLYLLISKQTMLFTLATQQYPLVEVPNKYNSSQHLLQNPYSTHPLLFLKGQLILRIQSHTYHQLAMHPVLSNQLIVLHKITVSKVNCKFEAIAGQQPTLQKLGLEILEIIQGFGHTQKLCVVELILFILNFEQDLL